MLQIFDRWKSLIYIWTCATATLDVQRLKNIQNDHISIANFIHIALVIFAYTLLEHSVQIIPKKAMSYSINDLYTRISMFLI